MNVEPHLQKYGYHIKTIDSHTMGESTRIVYDGFPKLPGKTMMDKKKYLMEHYDFLRSALVDAEKIGLELTMENIDSITDLGMDLLELINGSVEIRHPYLDITTVDLVEFYSHTGTPGADMKNCVIFGDAQADRSPCGTGASAKLATLVAKGELELGEEFVYESITGSLFRGKAVQEVEIAGGKGIIPQITGSAYITGLNEWIIDEEDPLKYGFLLGTKSEEHEESTRGKIVQAAWELFRKKGYRETEAAAMLLYLLVFHREWLKFRLRDIWCFFGTGICSIVFFNFCYFKAITVTSLSVAAILLYTAPAIVMVLSRFLFGEKFTGRKLLSLVLTFFGCVLVTGVLEDTHAVSGKGILIGLGAGLGYALYSIFSRYALERGYHSMTITCYTFVVAAVASLFLSDVEKTE